MNCFAELFAAYTEKLMELCLEEAYDQKRLYCYLAQNPPWQDTCRLCNRASFDDGAMDWHELKRVCDSEECRKLWSWIHAPGRDGGNKARIALKALTGSRDILSTPHGIRREVILATMLLAEARSKANDAKPRLRLAA